MHTQRTVHEDIVHETKEHTRLVIYIFGPGKNSVSQSKYIPESEYKEMCITNSADNCIVRLY